MDKVQEVRDRIEVARARLDRTSGDQVELLSLRDLVDYLVERVPNPDDLTRVVNLAYAGIRNLPPDEMRVGVELIDRVRATMEEA